MKLALVGYGKMGKMVEKSAVDRGHIVATKIGRSEWSEPHLEDIDVCIEFTTPGAAIENIKRLAEHKKDIVVGTTGWYDRLNEVEKIVKENGIGLLYAQNFSLGLQLYLKLIQKAATLFNGYDMAISEMHHTQKKDSPSGTALLMAEKMKNNPEISSLRVGSIPGTHSVIIDGECETVTLTHSAKNRTGFATGAVIAAEWLQGKKGIFTMDDLL